MKIEKSANYHPFVIILTLYLRNVYIVFSDVFRFSFLDKKYYAIELYLSRVYLYSGTCLI